MEVLQQFWAERYIMLAEGTKMMGLGSHSLLFVIILGSLIGALLVPFLGSWVSTQFWHFLVYFLICQVLAACIINLVYHIVIYIKKK